MTVRSEIASAVDFALENGTWSWYAVHTRFRCERLIELQLRAKGITTFLPLVSEVHRWSDRRKVIETALFGPYVFVRLAMDPSSRLKVLSVQGILGFVGHRGIGISIPDSEIDSVRSLVAQRLRWSPHPFPAIGSRVRVLGGALDGIEGTLVSNDRAGTLVVSVGALQRALAVSVTGYQVQVLEDNPRSFPFSNHSSIPLSVE